MPKNQPAEDPKSRELLETVFGRSDEGSDAPLAPGVASDDPWAKYHGKLVTCDRDRTPHAFNDACTGVVHLSGPAEAAPGAVCPKCGESLILHGLDVMQVEGRPVEISALCPAQGISLPPVTVKAKVGQSGPPREPRGERCGYRKQFFKRSALEVLLARHLEIDAEGLTCQWETDVNGVFFGVVVFE